LINSYIPLHNLLAGGLKVCIHFCKKNRFASNIYSNFL